MKDRYTLYKIILGSIYFLTFAIFVLAFRLSGDSEPPILVVFAGAFFAALTVVSNIFIDLARDFHSAARDLKELLSHTKKQQNHHL